MLIENKFKKGKVITIKLVTGEELLGTLCSDDNDDKVLKLSKLRVLVNTPNKTYGLAPYVITLDDGKTVSFNKNNIMFYDLTIDEYEKQYITITSSIII